MKPVSFSRSVLNSPTISRASVERLPTPHPSPLGERGVGGLLNRKKLVASVDDVLTLASSLTQQQQQLLLSSLVLRLQASKAKDTRDVDMWSQAVHMALQSTRTRTGDTVQGPLVIKRALSRSSAWTPVAAFMSSNGLDQLSVTQRQSMYLMLAKLVVSKAQYIARKGGAPMSANLVASVGMNMASIFDQAFPGYLENNLALLVAQQLTRSNQ